MKSTLCFTLTFLTFVTLTSVPESFAQETLPQYVVRQTYFHPSDRPPLPETDARLDRLVKSVQQFYADEMERQGFGRKTFRLETDARGQQVRHYVKGKFPIRDYDINGRGNAKREVDEYIDEHLGWSEQVCYLNFIEEPAGLLSQVSGVAGDRYALVGLLGFHRPTINIDLRAFNVIAHELGHAFGLGHDFRDDRYMMSYGLTTIIDRLSYCAVEGLDVNPFFNTTHRPFDGAPTIEMLPPAFVSPPNTVRLRFKITHSVRLHQASLHTNSFFYPESLRRVVYPGLDPTTLLDCKSLNGNNDTIEFITTQLAPATEYVGLYAIDEHNNATYKHFPIDLTSVFPDSEPVFIPDPNLAALIRETLGLAPGSPITKLDMLGLGNMSDLRGRRSGIASPQDLVRDLTGLQHAMNLGHLELRAPYNMPGEIRDLTPLRGLTQLHTLDLGNNQISDLRPLTGLTQLHTLDLGNNQISDLRPLAGLTQLIFLMLGNNNISDITPLTELTNLRVLELHGNQITDAGLVSLTELSQLVNLSLSSNHITDITPLAKLTGLGHLDLEDLEITDLTPLSGLTNLIWLSAGVINSDITPLAGLTNLRSLWLNYSNLSDLTPLAGLTELQSLHLENTSISDITPLAGLTELRHLNLQENRIRDVNPLKGLVNLRLLDLYGNPIKDKAPLFALLRKNPEIEIAGFGGKLLSLSDAARDTEGNESTTVENREMYVENGEMYWGSYDKILRATTDGTNRQMLLRLSTGPGSTYIALNNIDGKMYWIYDPWSGVQGVKIQRANLDGSHIEDLVTGLYHAYSIALDVAAGKMYWTAWSGVQGGKIQRANLDGSHIEDLLTGLGDPEGIALDVAGRKMYWTETNGNKIQRANLDGSHVEDLVTGDLFGAIALDMSNNKMYWTTFDRIQRANLDGSHVEDLVTGLYALGGIALDVAARKMYWTEVNEAKIRRANLDGSHVETLFTEQNSLGIALRIPEPSGPDPSLVPESIRPKADVNADGSVNIADLVLVASNLGKTGQNPADVNDDGQVNVADLVLVAGALGNAAAAPSLVPDALEMLTSADVRQWLSEARGRNLTDPSAHTRGIRFLEQLLTVLIPKETALLANYPNPFNPETWIPYQLAKDAEVTLTIYAVNGHVVRRLTLGHQPAGVYQERSRAAYWDGRNAFGEPVASGLYFYTLTAGNFSATRKMLIRK